MIAILKTSKSNWLKSALGELCEVNIGRTPARNRQDYWGAGHLWLSIADMNQGRNLETTKETITDLAVRECNCRLAPVGTVLLSFKLSIGKVGIARVPLLTNEAIAALPIRDESKLIPDYLYWAIQSIDLTLGLDRAAKGLTLNKAKLLEIEIPLPPLEEQKHIAEILDRTEELRSKRKEAIAQLDTLTQAIFIEMFGDFVTNPKRWEKCKPLGDIAEIVSGITKGRKLNGQKVRKIPYLAVVNVQDRRLDLTVHKVIEAREDEISRYKLQVNDLLLTEGGDPDKLGRGTLWNGELPECIHQNHIFRVRITLNSVHPLFLNWLVSSDYGKKYFLKQAKQTTGIATINMTQLREFPLLIPPFSLQQEFAYRVEAVEKLKASHRASLSELDALFASLQHRAFRGEL